MTIDRIEHTTVSHTTSNHTGFEGNTERQNSENINNNPFQVTNTPQKQKVLKGLIPELTQKMIGLKEPLLNNKLTAFFKKKDPLRLDPRILNLAPQAFYMVDYTPNYETGQYIEEAIIRTKQILHKYQESIQTKSREIAGALYQVEYLSPEEIAANQAQHAETSSDESMSEAAVA